MFLDTTTKRVELFKTKNQFNKNRIKFKKNDLKRVTKFIELNILFLL
jgi:hypothetical protein